MEIADLKLRAAELFPLAVKFAIANPGKGNPSLESLNALCSDHYEKLGFSCHVDCFSEIVPKTEDRLSLEAWCRTAIVISGWSLKVHFRPFHLGAAYGHFEIRHDGPLPGITETGYRSIFTPLATFTAITPEDYLENLIPDRPKEQQMMLF